MDRNRYSPMGERAGRPAGAFRAFRERSEAKTPFKTGDLGNSFSTGRAFGRPAGRPAVHRPGPKWAIFRLFLGRFPIQNRKFRVLAGIVISGARSKDL